MMRLFLRLWAKMFLAVLLAVAVGRVVVAPRIERAVGTNIGRILTPVARAMTAAIAEERSRGADLPEAVARVSERFGLGVSVALLPRAEVRGLDAARTAALDRGEAAARGDFESPQAYARLGSEDRVLAFTLPGSSYPYGQGRGIVMVLLLTIGISLGAALVAWLLGRRMGRLSRTARALGAGDLTTRAKVGATDSVGHLEATFNAMADEMQRLIAAHGDLLRMVSHELRTPMQRLHLSLEMAAHADDAAERERRLGRMVTDLEALDELIEELLLYSRLEKRFALERQPVHVADLLRDAADAVAELSGDVSIDVEAEPANALAMSAEPRLALRAVQNLVQNATRHAARRVVLRACRSDGEVRIDVDADWPGVPETERERVFAPFRRLPNSPEGAPKGHGLGLAIVRRIAESHDGRVQVSASPLGGARFQLWLPAAG